MGHSAAPLGFGQNLLTSLIRALVAGCGVVLSREGDTLGPAGAGMTAAIRLARAEDASHLPDLERSASGSFRRLPDLAWIADGQPTPTEDYLPLIDRDTVWVAADADGCLLGFLAAEQVGTDLHIKEVSVRAEHQGRGLGRRLIEAARAHAGTAGLRALTLTTFRDVAWNGPFYARLGFEVLSTPGLGPRLSAILASEAARGLPGERRCAMRLNLEGGGLR